MKEFPHSFDISPDALLFVIGGSMDERITHRIAKTVELLDGSGISGIREIIPSYASILAIYDNTVSSRTTVDTHMRSCWESTAAMPLDATANTVTIDVVYGDGNVDDLANVSAISGLAVHEVITLHASSTYTVGAVGFVPGFTYLIGLPEELATPRRATPRITVPAGSVGIGGAQTGVYALPSSGGWNLIGRSPTVLFDPAAEPPVRLKLGDRVRFQPVEHADFTHLERLSPQPEGDGPIEVVSPGLQTTIQDLGRYGVARFGFATDGAADRRALVRANRAIGNPASAAALEITLQGPTLRFHRRMRFCLDGADLGGKLNGRAIVPGRSFETMPGDELSFSGSGGSAGGARAYLAVAGGFDVPLVMGSASTNLTAQIGGWYGRALVRGDRLSIGQRDLPSDTFTPGLDLANRVPVDTPFRVVPGPQRHRFNDATWQRLISEPFEVSNESNRVGLRLLGPSLTPVDGADMLSEGILTGSIQVTSEGNAIVMLPGHATIGGYTKIATVVPADWDRLGQLAPGDTVRFSGV